MGWSRELLGHSVGQIDRILTLEFIVRLFLARGFIRQVEPLSGWYRQARLGLFLDRS